MCVYVCIYRHGSVHRIYLSGRLSSLSLYMFRDCIRTYICMSLLAPSWDVRHTSLTQIKDCPTVGRRWFYFSNTLYLGVTVVWNCTNVCTGVCNSVYRQFCPLEKIQFLIIKMGDPSFFFLHFCDIFENNV